MEISDITIWCSFLSPEKVGKEKGTRRENTVEPLILDSRREEINTIRYTNVLTI